MGRRKDVLPDALLQANGVPLSRTEGSQLPWRSPRRHRQFASPLRFDERGQPSAAALAKLAGAQRIRQGFQIGDAVDCEVT